MLPAGLLGASHLAALPGLRDTEREELEREELAWVFTRRWELQRRWRSVA